ncbi:uncharacterized protein BO97DRAFT_419578 [Aspergillus homomorphus CBS 101889]|uniref:NADH:flavin oxidoreductase/NADH oxidase N-terminal domain-containing protein n=1 Tax=Aspergillus homomorphus (strain CBS 101889) TaxID=1450537 RepID=A0A395IGL5_ASPHC|nr:hypothetical protein BO97DRAFT_419578 [Aspergillus homomorphus CBS 101889]RAL17334.1 hypothetical protein BO97DRAFT_419578 [Aspergillus homomorphus CBS 101889]
MQFLSPKYSRRTGHYGRSIENRSHILFEVINGIRAACRSDFQIGLRVSMERYGYGVSLVEMREVVARALRSVSSPLTILTSLSGIIGSRRRKSRISAVPC